MATIPVTERFKAVYRILNKDNLSLVDTLYADTVAFEDPIHKITGLRDLKNYLAKLYAGIHSCTFSFETDMTGPGAAKLTWTMVIRPRDSMAVRQSRFPGSHTSDMRKESYTIMTTLMWAGWYTNRCQSWARS